MKTGRASAGAVCVCKQTSRAGLGRPLQRIKVKGALSKFKKKTVKNVVFVFVVFMFVLDVK